MRHRKSAGEPPLLLCEVLEEEYRSLHGPLSYIPSWLLTEDQLILSRHAADKPELVFTLMQRKDALSAFLLQKVGEFESTQVLVQKLNEVLQSERPYQDELFSHVPLTAETRKRMQLNLRHGQSAIYLNRVLLEEAYPEEIQKVHEVRLRKIYRAIHRIESMAWDEGRSVPLMDGEKKQFLSRSALCISGGGIRSATFALGVLQALAQKGLLERFDYLSTVSGGGYIGSWLSAWIHRHPRGLSGVIEELEETPEARSKTGLPGKSSVRSKLEPEPAPIRHLRAYSSYLSPKLGFLSADAWTLAGTYLRNLVLNWLMIIPLIAAALAVPRLLLAVVTAAGGSWAQFAVLALGFCSGAWALAYAVFHLPSVTQAASKRGRLWRFAQTQEGFLCFCLAPLLVSAVSLVLYWAWHRSNLGEPYSWWAFAMFGMAMHGVGWLIGRALLLQVDTGSRGQKIKAHFRPWEILLVALTGFAGGLLAGWGARVVFLDPTKGIDAPVNTGLYACLSIPFFLTLFLLAATLFVGVVSRWTSDEDREWWGRLGAWVLIALSSWAVASTLVVFGPVGLLALSWKLQMIVGSASGLSGLVAVLLGRSADTKANPGQNQEGDWRAKLMNKLSVVAAPLFLVFFLVMLSLATSWVIRLLSGTELVKEKLYLPDSFSFQESARWPLELMYGTHWLLVAAGIAGLAAFGVLISWLMNINKFSLHAMYRDRLIRAYLGATRTRRGANPFTGFDPDDNMQIHELQQGFLHVDSFKNPAALILKLKEPQTLVQQNLKHHLRNAPRLLAMIEKYDASQPPPEGLLRMLVDEFNRLLEKMPSAEKPGNPSSSADASLKEAALTDMVIFRNRKFLEEAFPNEVEPCQPPPRKPLHVINMALNLVRSDNLAWQQRKAETFTVSSSHAGNFRLGYRRSENYGRNAVQDRAISLGTAMAISGAAASPNMGYHSSPVLTFLMTLFNVRLGWWLGNPGVYGQRTFAFSCPTFAVGPLVQEALGLTDDKSKYIYLSDGGHFENLGLYEMVIRRCHFIVMSDAGCDPDCSFEDLANAIRKIRIDLGVPITLDEVHMYPRDDEKRESRYCAKATINYPAVDGEEARPGVLIYLKPVLCPNQPIDIFNYSRISGTFPHEGTGDQFFSESQFESYRMLGYHAVEEIFRQGSLSAGPEAQPNTDRFAEFQQIVLRYLGGHAGPGGGQS